MLSRLSRHRAEFALSVRPVFVVGRAARLESVKHPLDLSLCLPRARRESGNDWQNRSQVSACNSRSVAARTMAVRGTLLSSDLPEPLPRTSVVIRWPSPTTSAAPVSTTQKRSAGSLWRNTACPAGTWTGSKPRASCSIAGSGNGCNIGTP